MQSKHLKGRSASRVGNVTFFDQLLLGPFVGNVILTGESKKCLETRESEKCLEKGVEVPREVVNVKALML